MEKRNVGYYWIQYPDIIKQVAYWNGYNWLLCGIKNKIPPTKIKIIGEYIGPSGIVVDLN